MAIIFLLKVTSNAEVKVNEIQSVSFDDVVNKVTAVVEAPRAKITNERLELVLLSFRVPRNPVLEMCIGPDSPLRAIVAPSRPENLS